VVFPPARQERRIATDTIGILASRCSRFFLNSQHFMSKNWFVRWARFLVYEAGAVEQAQGCRVNNGWYRLSNTSWLAQRNGVPTPVMNEPSAPSPCST
jgi:hypothetical protein